MLYTVRVKQVLFKDIVVEAVNESDAIQQAVTSESILDTDDIETTAVSIGHFIPKENKE